MQNGYMTPRKGAKGTSGTIIHNGIITGEEYLSDLTRYQAFTIYDKMRKGDGTTSSIIAAISLPIIQAHWTIDHGSDEKAGEMIEHELFHGDIEFKAVLREMVKTGLAFGFAVFEQVLANRGDYVGLAALESRKQKTIYAWEMENKQAGITQMVVSSKYSIPMNRLMIFTNDKEGDNYEGVSILRGAYKHWMMKDDLYLFDMVKNERQSNGIPFAKGDFTPTEKASVEETLANIRANEQSYLIMPASTDEMGFVDMKAGTTVDLQPSIDHHDRQSAKSALLQFIDIGSAGASGSLAASNDQKELYYLAIEAIADNVSSTFQKVIDRLVYINCSNVEEYPKLIHSKIGTEDIEKLANAVSKFVAAGVITPDAQIEQNIRKAVHLPEASDDIEKTYDAKLKAITDGAAGMTDESSATTKKADKDAKAVDADVVDKKDAKADALKKASEAKFRLIDIVV